MTKEKSPIDNFFHSIFGFTVEQPGKSYELLVAAALKHIHKEASIKSHQMKRGAYSGKNYQIDALIESIESTFVEAKDYTERNSKVGRPDVTKLSGALNDLDIDKGVVASATGFTSPAVEYAKASQKMPLGKKIDLYNIRQSTEEDEKGRIKKIHLNIYFYLADYKTATWSPVFTDEGKSLLKGLFDTQSEISFNIDSFYREDGTVLHTILELTSQIGVTNWDKKISEGEWEFEEKAFLKVNNSLISIQRLKYCFPYNVLKSSIEIEAEGKASLLVQSMDGTIDKILTDIDLKKTIFTEDGEVNV